MSIEFEPPPPQLTSSASANVLMSHGTLDAGIKLDIQAQAYVNSKLVSSGKIDSVSVGSNVGPGVLLGRQFPLIHSLLLIFFQDQLLVLKFLHEMLVVDPGKFRDSKFLI